MKEQKNYYPWVVLSLSALFLFYNYVLQVSPSVMAQSLMHTYALNGFGLGNLVACYFYAYFFMQLLAGPLLDKYSPRYLTTVAIFCCALGALGFALSHQLWVAALSRAVIGVGAAFTTVSYMKMASLWFKPRQFALIGGLLATAAMAGSMAGEAPLALAVNYFSWREVMLLCSLVGVVLSVAFFSIVRDGGPHRPDVECVAASDSITDKMRAVLALPANWLLLVYSGLAFTPVAVFGGLWGNMFLEASYQMTPTQAASCSSVIFLGLAVGGPLLGSLSDRLGRRYLIMWLGLLLSLFSCFLVLYVPHLSSVVLPLALFVFGFGTGAFMLGFTVGKELNDLALTATVIALINSGDAFFGAVTEPAIGRMLDMVKAMGTSVNGTRFSLHAYDVALMVLPLYLLLALVFLSVLQYLYPEGTLDIPVAAQTTAQTS
jgi:MFS family permease